MGRKRKADPNNDEAKVFKNQNELDKSNFADLPHEILLKIFSYLNLNTRCRIASVCRSWHNAVYDETLWYHIDLDSYINLKKLWKLVRHSRFSKAKSIKIIGNLNKIENFSQNTLSPLLMEKLSSTCFWLNSFEVKYADLNSIKATNLPGSINSLKLIRCEIPVQWFLGSSFVNLVHLDLTDSSRICSIHIKDLSASSQSLERLNLSKCYRIDDSIINILADNNFEKLKSLELEDVPNITTICLQLVISLYVKINRNFKYMNVKNCPKVNCDTFKNLFEKYNIDLKY